MSSVLNLWAGVTGAVLDFAGTTAPSGWLMCYGQAVSRATYANLFAVIGTTYGAGDGANTFNLPDCRGRVGAGKDDMGGNVAGRLTTAGAGVNGATLGASGGAQTHTLTTVQMPAHNHGVTDPGHNHAVTDPTHTHSVYDPGHSHTVTGWNLNAFDPTGGPYSVGADAPNSGAVGTGQTANASTTGVSLYAAATGISIQNKVTGISTQNNGSGGAHNNTQPTIVFNKIIKI